MRTVPGAAPRRRSWRRLFVAGWVMVVLGLCLLGYVAWQFYGTNWVSHRTQHRLVQQVERQWDRGVVGGIHTNRGTVVSVIHVPRFGTDYAVPIIEGTSPDALAAGVGHYTDTAAPGQRGNFALAGHRVTHGEPFRDLPDLRPGDTVVVETSQRIYTYVLDTAGDGLTVPFTATWVLAPVPVDPHNGAAPDPTDSRRLITLTTCSELFHTDNRLVVFGHLEASRPR